MVYCILIVNSCHKKRKKKKKLCAKQKDNIEKIPLCLRYILRGKSHEIKYNTGSIGDCQLVVAANRPEASNP